MGVTTQKENGTFVSYTYEGMPVSINIPYSSMNELVGDMDYFYSMTVQSDTTKDSQKVATEIIRILEQRHQCAGDEYFQVQNFQDVMKSMNQMLGMVTAFIFCGRDFTSGRRYWRYEYYAGFCNRTYQGNRNPQVPWSQNLLYHDAVSGRSSDSYGYWGNHWNYSGNYRRLWNLQRDQCKHANDNQAGHQP